jgi:beta-glucosidase
MASVRLTGIDSIDKVPDSVVQHTTESRGSGKMGHSKIVLEEATSGRREFFKKCAQLAAGLTVSGSLPEILRGAGQQTQSVGASAHEFPKGFLWGAATAAHQVEGNNVNSDLWLVEHLGHSMFREPSGDACDHYHLYEQDIGMLADFGLTAYRFSIEWARIEPERGYFSQAELRHYRRMLEACHRRNITPLVTYSHFTAPRWFAMDGGWENSDSPNLFADYCEHATQALGDLTAYAITFNEPDVGQLLRWTTLAGEGPGSSLIEKLEAAKDAVRQQLDAPRFSSFLFADAAKSRYNMLAAHEKGKAAIKSVRGSLPVGFTLAMEDDQPAETDSHVDQKRADVYGPWLKLAKKDDYIGVQTYTRSRVAAKNEPPPDGAELTQMGYEFYPESLEHTIRYASKETGVPVIVTENGVATEDDRKRVEYIQRALQGVSRSVADGIDVRGYIHWSLMDNFEWIFGYMPKFGLATVDRETQRRTPKPSAAFLGNIAKKNAI